MRAKVVLPDGVHTTHYFNKIHGVSIDLTRSQFPEGTEIGHGEPYHSSFDSTRDYILSNEGTRSRYEKLKSRVEDLVYKWRG